MLYYIYKPKVGETNGPTKVTKEWKALQWLLAARTLIDVFSLPGLLPCFKVTSANSKISVHVDHKLPNQLNCNTHFSQNTLCKKNNV